MIDYWSSLTLELLSRRASSGVPSVTDLIFLANISFLAKMCRRRTADPQKRWGNIRQLSSRKPDSKCPGNLNPALLLNEEDSLFSESENRYMIRGCFTNSKLLFRSR